MQVIRKDGCFINISITLSSVLIKGKWHSVGIVRDITDRKRAEEELIASKKRAEASDRLKTAFINNISHEVKTPLNGILGFSSLITQHNLPKNEKEEFFSIIKESSLRLLNTMTSFMDISMLVSGNMLAHFKSFDLHRTLHELRDQFQPMCMVKNLEFQLCIPEENERLILYSDPEFIRKALSCLITR